MPKITKIDPDIFKVKTDIEIMEFHDDLSIDECLDFMEWDLYQDGEYYKDVRSPYEESE